MSDFENIDQFMDFFDFEIDPKSENPIIMPEPFENVETEETEE
jgi:hypothetical protein